LLEAQLILLPTSHPNLLATFYSFSVNDTLALNVTVNIDRHLCHALDLSQRVDSVKEENLKLKSENQVLGQYIENLMAASSVFQSTSPKAKKK
jgi:Short coiled-coil protein